MATKKPNFKQNNQVLSFMTPQKKKSKEQKKPKQIQFFQAEDGIRDDRS